MELSLIKVFAMLLSWVGHSYLLMLITSYLYGQPYRRTALKVIRAIAGLLILTYIGLLLWSPPSYFPGAHEHSEAGTIARFYWWYSSFCLVLGGVVYPLVNVSRALKPRDQAILCEKSRDVNFQRLLGTKVTGNGKHAWVAKLPGNGVFKVSFTEFELAIPRLPRELDGLTILFLSDLHFHGTPSREFFHEMLAIAKQWPSPDLIFLGGDYLDSDSHHEWILELLRPLEANVGRFAILGNHDLYHSPEKIRSELTEAGYTMLGPDKRIQQTIRGIDCEFVGNESPWFQPSPSDRTGNNRRFTICLSHTPDNFYWAVDQDCDLVLAGHVHGGQIRIPLIGSIFVPSKFGRRFDCGVFSKNNTVMVVGRGISGREPIRFRCSPQVIYMKLSCVAEPTGESTR